MTKWMMWSLAIAFGVLPLRAAAFSPDGSQLAMVTDSGAVSIEETRDLLTQPQDGESALASLQQANSVTPAWHPDGTQFASEDLMHNGDFVVGGASVDGNPPKIITLPSPEQVTQETLPGFIDLSVPSPIWRPDATLVAVPKGSDVEIINTSTGSVVRVLSGHADHITGVTWRFDGTLLATSSFDQTVKIWEVNTGDNILTYDGHNLPVISVDWSPDGTQIVSTSGGNNGLLHHWDALNGSLTATNRVGVESIARFSPSGSEIGVIDVVRISVFSTGPLQLLHSYTTEFTGVPEDPNNLMTSLMWSEDGSRLLTGNLGGSVYLWDAATATPLNISIANPSYDPEGIRNPAASRVRAIAFSPNGSRYVAASADGTLRAWDGETYAELYTRQVQPLRAAAFSPDGSQLAMVTADGAVAVADTSDLLGTACGFGMSLSDGC